MNYNLAYIAAWVNAAVGVVCGVLAAAYPVAHPTWLSSDIAATCGILVLISAGLAALLPQITRTPAQREQRYNAALRGQLPKDLAGKPPG